MDSMKWDRIDLIIGTFWPWEMRYTSANKYYDPVCIVFNIVALKGINKSYDLTFEQNDVLLSLSLIPRLFTFKGNVPLSPTQIEI